MNDGELRVFACVKQVPDAAKVDVDEKTGVLKRDGVESKMNPYDLYAVEAALRLREASVHSGGPAVSVTAITMGPPQAEAVLKEAIMMGADRGVLLTDRRFAGSDVLATAYALSQGLRRAAAAQAGAGSAGPFSGRLLVICGRQTTDGDTAQVGPEIAEFLGVPHIANVRRIAELKADSLVLESDLPGMVATAEISFPCLITVEKEVGVPRLPSFRRKLAMAGGLIARLGLDGMEDTEPGRYGIDGSPTNVMRIFPPSACGDHETWTGSGAELTARIGAKLAELKFVDRSILGGAP